MFDLNQYKSPSNEFSLYKNIPIAFLKEAKQALKDNGIKYQVKYRGPRNVFVGDTRGKFERQASCLRKFATSFAVYNPPYRYGK